jgi:hypothetical protein
MNGREDSLLQGLGRETRGKELRHRWEDTIKRDLQTIGWGVGCIDVAQDRNKWQTILKMTLNLLFP